jgi:hypothetical protein
MPTKSPAQARLMRAAAHDPEFAKKVKVPQEVAKEFVDADKKEKEKAEKDKKKKADKKDDHHTKSSITTRYKKEA